MSFPETFCNRSYSSLQRVEINTDVKSIPTCYRHITPAMSMKYCLSHYKI